MNGTGNPEPDRPVIEYGSGAASLQLLLENKLIGRKKTLKGDVYSGASAAVRMSDHVPPGFLEAVTRQQPDGYLIGVGMGGLLIFQHCFKNGIPQGVVSVDINPQVVLTGRLFVEMLKKSETREELISNFFKMSDGDYENKLLNLAKKDKDHNLRDNFLRSVKRYKRDHTLDPFHPPPASVWYFAGKDVQKPDLIANPGQRDLVINALLDNFEVFHELALGEKIASIYADILDPTVINAITELPRFHSARNIIYLSDMFDVKTELGYKPGNAAEVAVLKPFEQSLKPTIFIDSLLSQKLDLRMQSSVPDYR